MSKLQIALITVGVILLLVCIAAAAAVCYIRKNGVKDYDKTGLTYAEYSLCGGMEDETYIVRITVTGPKTAKIELYDQESHGSPVKKKHKTVQKNKIDGLYEIIEKYSMQDWKNLPKSEIFALDEPTARVEFVISGKSYSFSDDMEFPEGAGGAMREIRTYIENLF